MTRLLKDPLILFLIVGTVIYVASETLAEPEVSYDINVSEAVIKRISDQWQMQMRRPPTAEELDGLIGQHIKEEIYYREATRMGLAENDTIVRRRLVQKLTFLTEDVATAVPQTEAELRAYFDANLEHYRVPDRFSFEHRYFSSDRRTTAEQDAREALEDEARRGDPFMLQRSYTLRSEREIGDLFGREFAAGLAALQPAQTWQGPLRSAYGWHPVKVTGFEPSHLPEFAAIMERVRVDAQQAQRRDANQAYYESLREQYDVSIATPAAE